MTKRLIEEWLPIAALGEESVRERRSMTALPPTYYLHVWWARRPLVASRAAVLASLLPADADRDRFMHVLGIHGDPVAAKRAMEAAVREGKRIANPYSYDRAFGYSPNEDERRWLEVEAAKLGIDSPSVLDPTAGGGSIPFEARRLGLVCFANDLNPVAAVILKATVEWPAAHGIELIRRFAMVSEEFSTRVKSRLETIYPQLRAPDELDTTYLYARTIACPHCDGLIPLSPNWRLAPDGTGVRLRPDNITRRCTFEIVKHSGNQSDGTVARGVAHCPFEDCGRVVDGDEIKRQAQADGMGEQLFAIVYKVKRNTFTKAGKQRKKWVREFRAPRPQDENSESVQRLLEEKLPEWEATDIMPTEVIPSGLKTSEPLRYGMGRWRDLFSPRQLLCHGIGVEVYRELLDERNEGGELDDITKAAFVYLSFALDKLLNYNSRMSIWMSTRAVIANTFNRHDFAFCWSYAEMDPLIEGLGFDWVLKTIKKCIAELIDLARPDIDGARLKEAVKHGKADLPQLLLEAVPLVLPPLNISNTSGDSLHHIDDRTIDVVVMDPPYYDNVMYAELSDFFYVWLKRTAGYVYPEFFRRNLTDKENEAVANSSRFQGQKGAKVLAGKEYQQRMASMFAECRRVLTDDGLLTLMFTHKATGAWDALASGLLEAGFAISASWPVNTEAESSMHIKDKAAAKSTILLVCRPRPQRSQDDVAYWEDVEPLVASAVRTHIQEFQDAGINGVDLYLSCFGPALEEFSNHWPMTRGTPRPEQAPGRQRKLLAEELDPYAVTPEDALDAARREVKAWRMEQLLRTTRRAELDGVTEWFVLAWDAFRAPQFPYDEGLRLARVVGVDLDREIVKRVAEKKASNLILWDSAKRAAKGTLGAPDGSRSILDAIHHAAHKVRSQSLEAAKELLDTSGASGNPSFTAGLAAVLEVLPVSSTFTGFKNEKGAVGEAASDFDALEHLRRLAFSDRVQEPEQLKLWAD